MNAQQPYRVISRKRAAWLVIGLLILTGIAAVLIADWTATYLTGIGARLESNPEAATAQFQLTLRILAAGQFVLALALVAYLLRFGLRSKRCQMLPPPGSWVVEGRPVRRGEDARRISRIIIGLALVIGIVALAISALIWQMGEQFLTGLA